MSDLISKGHIKRIAILFAGIVLINILSACASPSENKGVYYIYSQSSYYEGKCSLCFENTSDKTLGFCVYGVFNDKNRSVGLDSNGNLKTAFIKPYTKANIEFCFNDVSSDTIPKDVIIIGDYK